MKIIINDGRKMIVRGAVWYYEMRNNRELTVAYLDNTYENIFLCSNNISINIDMEG